MLRFRRTVFALTILAPSAASAQTVEELPAHAAESQPDQIEARRAYEEGRAHYSLGEYPEAIALFRKAYELSAAPGLLFDIAQAYRLSGNCTKAIELYRHFARLAPDSSRRGDADGYVERLTAECDSASTRAPVLEASHPSASTPPVVGVSRAAPPEPPKTAPTARLGWSLLGAGLGVGLGAGVLYLWNDNRFSTWQREDRTLSMPPPSSVSAQDWIARQNTNDDLLRSIHSADHAVVALVGVSAFCIVSSAIVALIRSERGPDVALRTNGLQLSWAFP